MRMVFDASALISVSQTCLIKILGSLQKELDAEFFIPQTVFEEAVQRPIQIKRFELNAIRIKKAIEDNWFKVVSSKDGQLFGQIEEIANNCFFVNGKPIALLQRGEIEALCLVKELSAEAFAIDERTTRMLIENPVQLQGIMQERRGKSISIEKNRVGQFGAMFRETAIVRSVELIVLADELGLLKEELPLGQQSLEAALFAAKYSGCAVSGREINLFLQETFGKSFIKKGGYT